jgi:hypothetical protein
MLKDVPHFVGIVHPLPVARKDDDLAHVLERAFVGLSDKPLGFQQGIIRRKVSGARAAAKRAHFNG